MVDRQKSFKPYSKRILCHRLSLSPISFLILKLPILSILLVAPNLLTKHKIQKQPFIGVRMKRCSENIQQIYGRTPILKRDFKKVAFLNFIEITLPQGCSPVNFRLIFRTPFPKNTYGQLLLKKGCTIVSKDTENLKNATVHKFLCYLLLETNLLQFQRYVRFWTS